jgi:phosphoglucosamine mutase
VTRKYFGTDGIRGRVGEYPITPDFALKLGWAVGRVLAKQGKKLVLIGKDTRISGYMFESALEAGLSSAGVDIRLLGPMPTPGIAYLTRTFKADAGIVISASHNPYYDNGIKFFSSEGTKLDDDIELEIEAMMDQPMLMVAPDALGKARRITDAAGRYIEFCKGTVFGLSLAGKRIVLDCAHGATYHIAPSVFQELGAEVTVINAEPDGLNINRQCGSTLPKTLQAKVLEIEADLGVAFDGDGDRVLMVDHAGEVVDGDELLWVISRYYQESGLLHDSGVVGTLMSNMGLELALKQRGIPFVRAKVGDRYVVKQLKDHNWILGGEASGHLLCLDATTTGDGIVSALQVMQSMQAFEKRLHELKRGMKKMPQITENVIVKHKDIVHNERVLAEVKSAETALAGRGRVLLRPSGTEPKIRVMVEGEDYALVEAWAQKIAAAVKTAEQEKVEDA